MTNFIQFRGHRRPLEERFWQKVAKSDGCWLWLAKTNQRGYGTIRRVGGQNGDVYAHRLSWELHFGVIPDGLFVCHRCDTPSCVRPDHLFLGTPADNMADMVAKGRRRKGDQSPFSKLSSNSVAQIRARYEAGGIRQRDLADAYGVSESLICLVLQGRRW